MRAWLEFVVPNRRQPDFRSAVSKVCLPPPLIYSTPKQASSSISFPPVPESEQVRRKRARERANTRGSYSEYKGVPRSTHLRAHPYFPISRQRQSMRASLSLSSPGMSARDTPPQEANLLQQKTAEFVRPYLEFV
jgi:hypothetical protein